MIRHFLLSAACYAAAQAHAAGFTLESPDIKANGLQDAKDKRSINADAKLLPVFGKPQVTMFELAGVVGKHLSPA